MTCVLRLFTFFSDAFFPFSFASFPLLCHFVQNIQSLHATVSIRMNFYFPSSFIVFIFRLPLEALCITSYYVSFTIHMLECPHKCVIVIFPFSSSLRLAHPLTLLSLLPYALCSYLYLVYGSSSKQQQNCSSWKRIYEGRTSCMYYNLAFV